MPRNYVNNSMNQSLGRVGMPVGSAVHSRSSTSSYSPSSVNASSSSSRAYVDNAMNRSLDRVGLPVGSAVHSRSSQSSYSPSSVNASSSSSRAYVDNAMNRSLDRVGLPIGSAVHSKSSQSSYTTPSTYVDNQLNRRLGRVGLERGTSVYSKSENSVTSSPKTYVDNAYNRRLGRVGKPLGAAIDSKSKAGVGSGYGGGVKTYVDNAYNRKLERVGKPLGSVVVSKLKCNPHVFDFNRNDCRYQNMGEIYETYPDYIVEEIDNLKNLLQAKHDAEMAKTVKKDSKIDLKPEQIIPFGELELGDKIGSGGFGDVHVAFWKGQQVAVKKLRVQRVTQARKKQFEDEVRGFTGLCHPNIVKFYGACVVTPNLALVMELLPDGSLYDNLYYSDELQFDEKTKNALICDGFSALQYMHYKKIVHRDIKSKNVMLYDDKKRCKLADFGLALKDDTESNVSTKDFGFAGTEKYCPKEVIEGERLTIEELLRVDVYSLALTSAELLAEKEPFDGRNIHQIRKAIKDGEIPIPMEEGGISTNKKKLLVTALSKNASERPTAAKFLETFKQIIAAEN